MRKTAALLCSIALGVLAPVLVAQESPKPAATPKADSSTTPIKIQVVFTELEGKKKIKSLPYTLYHNTTHGSELQADFTRLRLTWRVPVTTDSSRGSWQYLDLATKMDCRAVRNDQGQFVVRLNVERSWVDLDPLLPLDATRPDQEGRSEKAPGQPTIRNISYELNLLLRDGQTLESVAATDPTTGRVIVMEVTLNVLK